MLKTDSSRVPEGHERPADERRPAVAIETHGCKLNQADSDVLARHFLGAGYRVVSPGEVADVYVVNTCTVTHVADGKARQSLRAAHRLNPGALVVATGCYAERAPKELAQLDGVTLVVGNRDKASLVEQVAAYRHEAAIPSATSSDGPLQVSAVTRTRAFLKIQEGCDQICAYCIVPKVRGRERSIPAEELLQQVRNRVQEGYREVVLTGTQLGSYGFDLPRMTLTRLLERLLKETRLERLRVSSLQPQEITQELIDLWSDPRLCPHFHMPLQSGSDAVLKRMRRRYSAQLYAQKVALLRERIPGVSITADLIVGFPGEGEAEFLETHSFCQDMRFAAMHVFPYSTRPGTSAAYFPDKVDPQTKRARMEQMLQVARCQALDFRNGLLGQTRPVLWEGQRRVSGRRVWEGLTDNYIRVRTEHPGDLSNSITPAEITRCDDDGVYVRTASLPAASTA